MDNEFKMDEIICPSCNFVNKPEAKFCQSCGSPIEIKEDVKTEKAQSEPEKEVTERVCDSCNIYYPVDIKYCRQCGKSLENEEEKQKKNEDNIKEKGERKKKAKGSKAYAIIKSSIVLFLSFVFLICAFSPVVTYEVGEEYIENLEDPIEVGITPFENIVYLFDSMKEYDEEGIKYDDLYEDFEDISGELDDIQWEYRGDDYIYLSYEEEEIIVEYAKIVLRLSLISNLQSPSPELIFNAVVSLLYIAFAFVFFGISVVNFIKALRGKGINNKLLTSLVCLAPFFTGFIYAILSSGYVDSNMGDAGAIMFWFILAIGALIAERFVFAEKKIKVSQIIISASCVLLCMIVMSASFGFVFNTEIRGKFVGSERIRGVETTFDSSFYQGLESNQKIRDEVFGDSYNTDIERDINKIIKEYTAAEVKNGEADMEVALAVVLTMYRWMKDASVFMCAVYYIGALVALLAALAGWRCLAGFMNEENNNRRGIKLFSLLALIIALVFLVLNCVFIFMFNSMTDIAGIGRSFSMTLNGDVTFNLFMAAGAFVLSLFISKKKKEETEINE